MTDSLYSHGKSTAVSLHSPWKGKVIQLVLAICCFALPVSFLVLTTQEDDIDLWVRVGFSTDSVRKILIADSVIPLQYALIANRGIYRSVDDGMTWQAMNSGFPAGVWGEIKVLALAIDAHNPSVLYAGMSSIGRRDKELNTGLYISRDGGATWLGVGQDMAGKEIQAISVMPVSSNATGSSITTAGMVCVAAINEILCSTDEGQSWLYLDWPGVEIRILSLAICPDNPQVIYVGTAGGGIYATDDGGISWRTLNKGLEDLDVYDIAISKIDSRLMYAATNGGVYKSTDGGALWTKLGGAVKGRCIYAIALHPRNDIIFAGARHGGVYYSIDGGTRWVPLRKGLGNMTVLSLALSPRDMPVLWAGTTDGIWHCVVGAPVPPAMHTPLEPSVTLSPSPTYTTSTMTPWPTHTKPQPSATASPTESPTATSSPTVTHMPSPTATYTASPSPTYTATPAPTPTAAAAPPSPVPSPPVPTKTPVRR